MYCGNCDVHNYYFRVTAESFKFAPTHSSRLQPLLLLPCDVGTNDRVSLIILLYILWLYSWSHEQEVKRSLFTEPFVMNKSLSCSLMNYFLISSYFCKIGSNTI